MDLREAVLATHHACRESTEGKGGCDTDSLMKGTHAAQRKAKGWRRGAATPGPYGFQQAPEAETDENKEVPRRRQKY